MGSASDFFAEKRADAGPLALLGESEWRVFGEF